MGIHHSPYIHPIPIPMGISIGILIHTAALLKCAGCTRLTKSTGRQNSPKIRHLRCYAPSHNFVGLHLCSMHISTIGKKLLNGDTSSTCSHNMVSFSPLTAEISLLVWRTPANFSRFRVLASLLHRRRSTEVNQTLHDDVWPCSELVYYIYTCRGSCPVDRCKDQFASKSCVLYWHRYCTALEQWASAKLCGVQ